MSDDETIEAPAPSRSNWRELYRLGVEAGKQLRRNGPMKGIVLRPEYAALVAFRAKTTETRVGPPAGEMHTKGGPRPQSGCQLKRGERIAIISGRKKLHRGRHSIGPTWEVESDRSGLLMRGPIEWPYRLPFGAVVASAEVAGAWPVEKVRFDSDLDSEGAPPWIQTSDGLVIRASERHLGDFSEGRWVWPLEDVKVLRPIPSKGGQGVMRLDESVSDIIEARVCGVTARTIWEHCRTDNDLSVVFAKVPVWAHEWFIEVTAELAEAYGRIVAEVDAEAAKVPEHLRPEPGPYAPMIEDVLRGHRDRMEQRVWAMLRPEPLEPQRITLELGPRG